MTPLRSTLVSVGLALLLAVTSLHMAVARGQGTAVGEMVLCIGGGLVSVPVDAEGKPTGPAHICPDCALSFIALAGLPAEQDVSAAVNTQLLWPDSPQRVADQARRRALARGPPAAV